MSFDNIRLEKGMYGTGKSFTQNLESLDPSENYIGTSYEGLDAYQRQLKRFDIKPYGPDSSVVGKFFQSSDAAVLFPEYITRAVKYGLDESSQIKDIVAGITEIDSMNYKTMLLKMDDPSLDGFVEGGILNEAKFSIEDRTIKLKRRGKIINSSYDVIRFQKLDIFSVVLKKIGSYLAQTLMCDAVDAIISGDVTSNTAATEYTLTDSKYSYSALVDLWSGFMPYQLTTLIGSPETIGEILKQPEFLDPAAGLNFHGTGKIIAPFGTQLIRTFALNGTATVALDKSCALEMVKVGDIEINYGRLIDRQIDQIAVTAVTGFAQMVPEAAFSVDVRG
ncbi:MAG: phage major capsid protein [Clostridia bacterium]|nr:phage major capsid protein [Clostridia bacterium]